MTKKEWDSLTQYQKELILAEINMKHYHLLKTYAVYTGKIK
jgi:hypothetical protein